MGQKESKTPSPKRLHAMVHAQCPTMGNKRGKTGTRLGWRS